MILLQSGLFKRAVWLEIFQKSHRKYVRVRNKTDLISINETTKLLRNLKWNLMDLFNHY